MPTQDHLFKRLFEKEREQFQQFIKDNTDYSKKKKISAKIINTWKEDKTISIGGYVEYCGEDKGLILHVSLFFFDAWITVRFN